MYNVLFVFFCLNSSWVWSSFTKLTDGHSEYEYLLPLPFVLQMLHCDYSILRFIVEIVGNSSPTTTKKKYFHMILSCNGYGTYCMFYILLFFLFLQLIRLHYWQIEGHLYNLPLPLLLSFPSNKGCLKSLDSVNKTSYTFEKNIYFIIFELQSFPSLWLLTWLGLA